MSGFCSSCGNVLPPAARFCSACGSVVAGAPPAGYQAPGYQSGYQGYQPGYPPYPPYGPRLTRPLYGRQFAGVCAGLARTYGWDVGLIRIIAVVTGIFVFPLPEVFYLAGWIGIPEEPLGEMPLGQAPAPPPA